MNKNRFTISSITAVIAVVMLLLTVGTGATSIILLNTAHAQTAQTVTLGEPIFVEKGGVVIQKEIGPNRSTLKQGNMSVSPRVTIKHLIKGME
jgi:hypothetical protein